MDEMELLRMSGLGDPPERLSEPEHKFTIVIHGIDINSNAGDFVMEAIHEAVSAYGGYIDDDEDDDDWIDNDDPPGYDPREEALTAAQRNE